MRYQLGKIKEASMFNKPAEVERLAEMLIERVEALEVIAADIAAIKAATAKKAKGAANG